MELNNLILEDFRYKMYLNMTATILMTRDRIPPVYFKIFGKVVDYLSKLNQIFGNILQLKAGKIYANT